MDVYHCDVSIFTWCFYLVVPSATVARNFTPIGGACVARLSFSFSPFVEGYLHLKDSINTIRSFLIKLAIGSKESLLGGKLKYIDPRIKCRVLSVMIN